MKFESVYIEWDDSVEFDSGWYELEDIKEQAKEPTVIVCIGFIIDETKDYILISNHHSTDKYRADEHRTTLSSPFKIPKSAIRKRKTLKL